MNSLKAGLSVVSALYISGSLPFCSVRFLAVVFVLSGSETLRQLLANLCMIIISLENELTIYLTIRVS